MNDLRFDWITTGRELAALEPAWRALDDGHTPGVVFRSFEWQDTWWRVLGEDPRRRRALRVLVARDGAGAIRGILPMYVEDAPVARIVDRRRVALLADGVVGSDYLGLVARAEDERALAPRFARRIAEDAMLADADLIDLCDVLVDDPLASAGAAAFLAAGFADVTAEPRYSCPYARIDGSLQDYFASRPNGAGAQARRRRAALERHRGFRIRTLTDPDDVVGALDPLFALHHARWADHGGSEAITDGRVQAFHRAAARRLAERGWARLTLLTLGDEPIAAAYGFARGDRFAYYQSGLSPAWRKRSAGSVVLAEMIAHAFRSEQREIDFLRGDEPYKQFWADRARRTVSVRAVRATPRARLAARAQRALAFARHAARRTLPTSVATRLRRLVRA